MGTERVEVKVGQIWKDNDKRTVNRYVVVRKIEDGCAICIRCNADGLIVSQTTHLTSIRLDRFRPTSTGYIIFKQPAGPQER
jgi:hypothetical protein